MQIKILTTKGCAACQTFCQTARQAVTELGLDVPVVIADQITDLLSYRVMSLPALIINEEVITYGKHLTLNEMKELITAQQEK